MDPNGLRVPFIVCPIAVIYCRPQLDKRDRTSFQAATRPRKALNDREATGPFSSLNGQYICFVASGGKPQRHGKENHYDAKFKVLSENVRHHIKEEEEKMLPEAGGLKLDFDQLGREMVKRKRALLTNGFPPVGEEVIIKRSDGRGDSPAKAAKKTRKVPAKHRKA